MARLDPQTFADLVRAHHAAVYRSAVRVLRHAGDAEDVAQDVFLRALGGKVALAQAAEPRAVLCWLATQLSLNLLRGHRRRQRQELRAVMTESPCDPSDAAARHEARHAVRRLVDALPAELRLPLLLRYQDGLTFAAVGSALAIAESTAHGRVQQALDWLRSRLERLGLAAVAVPEWLADGELPAPPAGLEARLLALPRAVAAGVPALAKVALLGLLLVGLGATSLALGEGGPPPAVAAIAAGESTPAGAPLTPEPAPREPVPLALAAAPAQNPPAPPAPPAPPGRAQDTPTVLTGTVCDADAQPAAGVTVQAVAAGGLKPFALAATKTDQDGRFRLALPRDGQPVPATKFRLRVLDDALQLLQTDEFPVVRAEPPEPLQLVLPADAGVAATRFTLAVTVRGADDTPLAAVPVALYRDGDPAPRPGEGTAEAQGRTDAEGVVRLRGRKPGARLLLVDGRPLALRAEVERLAIAAPGAHAHAVRLRPGLSLQGTVRAVDGSDLEWANVWLEDQTTRLCHSHPNALGPGGAVQFAHLGEGPFTLRVDRGPFSPAAVHGVRPGKAPVLVELKRHDDERDVGQHLGELHGRLRDAAGATVAFTSGTVHALPLGPGQSTLLFDRIEPPRPVQTMVDRTPRERFHVVGLTGGTWAVVARMPGYAAAAQAVPLRDGELRADVDVPLAHGATLRGRVLDTLGTPVARAQVFVVGVGARADANLAAWDTRAQAPADRTAAAPSVLASSTWSAGDGTFELPGVPAGVALRVATVARGHAPACSEPLTLAEGTTRAGIELRTTTR